MARKEQKQAETIKQKCVFCGKEKDIKHFFKRANGISATCKECEQVNFDKLASECGEHIALYGMCLSTNTPFFPLLLPEPEEFAKQNKKWIFYNELIDEKGFKEKDGKVLSFFDGATNILKVFGRKLSQTDTAAFIQAELDRREKQQGTDEQRAVWGEEDNYTTADYNALDRMYNNRLANFKGQTVTDQMEYTLREVAKWSLLADKLRREKDIKGATDALKAIDNLLASECLRKKDEKPMENFRPDAWVVAFEQSGLMKDGDFLSQKELQDSLIKVMRGKGYDQSLDAIHQLEMNIVNNARRNEDKQTLYELPSDMEITDELGEFSKNEGEEEKAAKAYAQLTKVRFSKESGD